MADEIDTALADYEPTDSEDSVQDESVQMQNGDVDPGLARQNGTGAEGPIQGPNDVQLSDQELGGIANGQGAPAAVMSPAQLGNPNPMQAANSALSAGNDTALAQQDVTKAIGEKNSADADLLDAQAAQKAADEQEQKDLQASQNEALERTHAETERIQKQYDDFKFHDHWKEAAPANKALAILFSAIGGAANSRGLGPNEALKSMDDISEREYRKDVAELGKKENLIKWKREGEKDLASRYEKERAGLLVQQSSRLKMMGDLAQSQYLKTHPGATVDEAKQNVVVKGAYQKAAETYSAAVRDIYKIEAAKEAAKLKARKAGGGGNAVGLSDLIKMREDGVPDSEIARKAAELHIPPKVYLPAIKDVHARNAENAKTAADAEKKDSNNIKDPWTGESIGPSPSPRGLTVARKDQANGVQLTDLLDEYAAHVKKYGSNLTGLDREALAERNRLWAGVAAQKRVWSALPASESGLELEKAQVGGTGKLWDLQPQSLKSIENMKEEVKRVTKQRANILAGKPANYVPEKKAKAASPAPSVPPDDVVARARVRAANGEQKAIDWLAAHGK
jgi:hypothetical protein